ncbi:MAG TPA: IclR family transcriptional regulator [Acidimicrobiales bacterium]|nr:IclR family transcriptional regulator [Acidimicrobiales bacterium]
MSEPVVPDSETAVSGYLERLLDLIELVSTGPSTRSFRQMARLLGAPPTTVHRLLTLLIDRGYCRRTADGAFEAGPRLLGIGAQAAERPEIVAAARAVDELAEITGESASCAILVDDRIVLVARRSSPQAHPPAPLVGAVLAPHVSALGKAILAGTAAERRRQVLERFVPGCADAILGSLGNELSEVERSGHAIDEETFRPGLRCRAVSAGNPASGTLGGISLSGPLSRFTTSRADSVIPMLRQLAGAVVGQAC